MTRSQLPSPIYINVSSTSFAKEVGGRFAGPKLPDKSRSLFENAVLCWSKARGHLPNPLAFGGQYTQVVSSETSEEDLRGSLEKSVILLDSFIEDTECLSVYLHLRLKPTN